MNKKESDKIVNDILTKKSGFWEKTGRNTALRIFKKARHSISAYKLFLKKNNISISQKNTWDEFQKIPTTDKKTYLRSSSLSDLCYSHLAGGIVFSSTSGSTGKPFYFPRNTTLDWEYSIFLELYLKGISTQYKKRRTLVIIGFGMGVWIGGLITYKAFELVNQRTGNLSLITPGVNKKEIFNALRELSPQYDQTILVGYPPFIKDIIDEAQEEAVEINKLNIKFIFAAEAFTEAFREYLVDKTKVGNLHTETANIYGTADIGAMAFETPTSILIRRLVLSQPTLTEKVFGKINRTPTLTQYNPHFVHFETIKNEIVLTGDSEIPLVRYAVGDHGGTYSFAELKKILAEAGIDIGKEAKKNKIKIYELPFVFVYERTDLSTTLYGLQIYPETIREVLLRKKFQSSLTGKFTLLTTFDAEKNQFLEIHIEQKRNKKINLVEQNLLLEAIIQNLRITNSEFRELSDMLGERANPKLLFWNLGDPIYFPVGIKQKWVQKI
ncbi:MAG: hypothetical protein WC880_01930 [Candidatus Paceibacterota bacterium]